MIKFRNSRLKIKEEFLVAISFIWFCTLLVHNFTDFSNVVEVNGEEYFDCKKLYGSHKVSFNYDREASSTFHKVHENITLRPLLNCFKQDDPYLIKNIKELFVPPRRKNPEPAVNSTQIITTSHQELDFIQMVFDFKKEGFFIEAGAGNCKASVTETLQNRLNWTVLDPSKCSTGQIWWQRFELAVLRTIPWDKVDIEVFSIETDLAGRFQKDSSRQAIIDLVTSHGYTRFDHRNDINTLTGVNQNDLFVRNDIVEKYDVVQYDEK